MYVCAINQDKTEADPGKQIFKCSGQALLSGCLYPVPNFPQRTPETWILLQIATEPLYQGYVQLPTLPCIQVTF